MNSHTPHWDGQLFWAHVPWVVCMPVPEYGPACTMILSRAPPPKKRGPFSWEALISQSSTLARADCIRLSLKFLTAGNHSNFPCRKDGRNFDKPLQIPTFVLHNAQYDSADFPKARPSRIPFSCPKPQAPESKTSKPQTPEFSTPNP